jgi:hypothetical protein
MYIVAKFNEETNRVEFTETAIDSKDQLRSFQQIVGGYIEMPYISEKLDSLGIDIIINEEGKLEELSPSAVVTKDGKIIDMICGNIIFATHNDSGNTEPLTETQKAWLHENIASEEKIIGIFNKYMQTCSDVARIEW